MPQSIGTPALWGGFLALVFALMAVYIIVYRRNPHEMSMREASALTAGWVAVALLFGAGVFWHFGRRPAVEYLTGYIIEYALSVDNAFVFILIFKTFGVPPIHRRQVLVWGIWEEANKRLGAEKPDLEKEIARIEGQMAKTQGAIDREMLASIVDNFEKVMAEGPNPKKKHLLHRLVKKVLIHSRQTIEIWYALPNSRRFEGCNI